MTTADAATVRLGRLEHRGLLLGMSPLQTALVGVAVTTAVVAEYSGGAGGLLVTMPVWASLLSVALLRVSGRPAANWIPLLSGWAQRTGLGQRSFRAKTHDFGTRSLSVPGMSGTLHAYECPGTSAHLLHDRGAATVTATLRVSGRGFVLAQEDIQAMRVAGWGRLLAGLCQQRSVLRVQVLERHAADGGSEVRRWWAENAVEQSPWAARVLADLVADAVEHCDRHESLISVTLRAPSAARSGRRLALDVVEQQLRALAEAARQADLTVHGWLNAQELSATVRSAFDPDAPVVGASSMLVGPLAMEETWSSLQTDSAHHCVYWIQEWPRTDVHAGFLQPLILSPGARRCVSFTAEPIAAAKAIKDIRRAKVEQIADAAQRNRLGQVEDESVRAEAEDLVRRERELVAGHGDLRFVGLLTVTASSPEELAAACVATEAAAAQAMCELRKLVGQQSSAFACGALPLARRIS